MGEGVVFGEPALQRDELAAWVVSEEEQEKAGVAFSVCVWSVVVAVATTQDRRPPFARGAATRAWASSGTVSSSSGMASNSWCRPSGAPLSR